MSIKSFFNKLAEKREQKRRYKLLASAIRANDLDAVKSALAGGADAGFFPGKTKKMPISLAIQSGNAGIMQALLDTPKGQLSVGIWHYDFRSFNHPRDIHDRIYFLPTFLHAAIEQKQEDVAIVLAKSPFVDVEAPGEFLLPGLRHANKLPSEFRQIPTPLEFAKQQGMGRLAETIETRLKPVLAQRAQQEAQDLAAQADKKRAEAERLLREADALSPKKSPPKPGLNL